MAITIKQKDVDSLELLPPGTYPCILRSAKPGKSRAGNDKVAIMFEVDSGEHEERVIFYSPILVEENWAVSRILELLQAVDYPFGAGDEITSEIVAAALMDSTGQFDVTINHSEMSDGEVRENVVRVRKAASEAVSALLAEDEIPF